MNGEMHACGVVVEKAHELCGIPIDIKLSMQATEGAKLVAEDKDGQG